MTDTYNIRENDVTTIIASTGELGIKIGNQCFFFDAKHGFYELSKDKYVTSPTTYTSTATMRSGTSRRSGPGLSST